MKAKRISSNQAKELIGNVKSVIRLGGFETGKRTNLNKAIELCKSSYSIVFSSLEFLFEKEYQTEQKVRFINFLGENYEIWFESGKVYTFENEGEKFLIVTGLGFCNVYKLIEKDESKSFDDQPAITYNGDSKGTSIFYKGKAIKINCLLSNTKVCKWDKKYPENHNHYIITVSYEGKRLSFDWFDNFQNFKIDNIDKSREDMIEMFYLFLQDLLYKNEYSDKNDFYKGDGNTPALWNTLCKKENKYNRVFEGVDIYELANYLQEKFEL